jgi:hypothetical protein
MAKFNLSKLASKAKDLVDKNGDKIAGGVDKVTNKIDEKTKGKYHDKLEKVDAAAAKLDKTAKPEGEQADDTGAGDAAPDTSAASATAASATAATGATPDPVEAAAAVEDTLPPSAGQPPAAAGDFPEPS